MLAAIPTDESRILELFDLALRMVRERGPIPERLSEHFNSVLRQAKELARDPSTVSGEISPEAIQLARQLRETAGLSEAMVGVGDLGTISPPVARAILAKLGNHVAP